MITEHEPVISILDKWQPHFGKTLKNLLETYLLKTQHSLNKPSIQTTKGEISDSHTQIWFVVALTKDTESFAAKSTFPR